MAKFILFVRGGYDSEANLSAEEIQARIGKYRDWSVNLNTAGKLLEANKISDEPHILSRPNGKFVLDKPALTEETVGGYFVIEAADYPEALKLSEACPIFEHGGSLEIRQIEG
jgi:hypothetical protein